MTPPNRRQSPPRRDSSPPAQHRTAGNRTTRNTLRSFSLTCGVDLGCSPNLSGSSSWRSTQEWSIPFLPLPLNEPQGRHIPPTKPSTGCGTQIHGSGTPRGVRTWTAAGNAGGSSIIPLPTKYFTEEQKGFLGGGPKSSECGCVTVGVGCCVWWVSSSSPFFVIVPTHSISGNALGIHKTFCETHSLARAQPTTYTFLAEAVSPPLPHLGKARTAIEVSAPNTPRVDSAPATRFENWIGQLVDSSDEPWTQGTPADSPTHSELVDLGLEEEARINAMEEEEGSQEIIRQARGIRLPGEESRLSEISSHVIPLSSRMARDDGILSGREVLAWTLQNMTFRSRDGVYAAPLIFER
ncbi:hypothetical protein B0H16DRAFT_1687089 [Mycena metata]|uniref:Uncharacterized protein n=1 Tax=Mycena metata TaxID=1033252 RepID=A0AAD7JJ92_9AGAR|nr:hypothetical protein B0H16DRAFT_1687089 [Mycena metata]